MGKIASLRPLLRRADRPPLIHFAIARKHAAQLIRAFGFLKKPPALVNQDLGKLPAEKVHAHHPSLPMKSSLENSTATPTRVWQTGSGTQTNMNVNEVISIAPLKSPAARWQQAAHPP